MDTPTCAAPDEKKSKPSGQLEVSAERFNSSVARLNSSSIGELPGLVSEVQKTAGIPDVRSRQRAAPNRKRVGRNQYHRRNYWSVEAPAFKHFHPALATSAQEAWQPILSNASRRMVATAGMSRYWR